MQYDMLSCNMSKRVLPTLLQAHAELGQSRILDAVMAVLDDPDGNALTVREVARRAQVSERTVFRHYATRSDLARAAEPRVLQRLARLVPPATLDELFGYAEVLFPVLEENQHLIRSLLGSEFGRELLSNERRRRLANLQRLLQATAPDASTTALESTATSIRLLLSGTSWRFHRDECGLSLKQTIARVSHSVRALVEQLNARADAPSPAVS
jgi:AcrR family transcriptional regulator